MKEDRHYELTDETIEFDGHTLHRIRCTENFRYLKKGTLGGFVEGYENLYGDAWVGDDAKVYAGAVVKDRAVVSGVVYVCNGAVVTEKALVKGKSFVSGSVIVYGESILMNYATIVYSGQNLIKIKDSIISGTTIIRGACFIGDIHLRGDAMIESDYDYIVFKNWWSSGRYFIWTRSNDMWSVGCFYGTGKELIAKAYEDSNVSGREYERVVKYVEQIKRDSKPSLWQRVKKMLTGK